MSTVGDKIRQVRVARNLTQQDLADKMGLKRNTISQWESGSRNVSVEQLIEIAKVVGVTLDYFNDAPPERTMFQLMAQLDSVFNNAQISESDKDKAYQDIMQIYLDSKKASKQNPASKENTLLNIKEE